MRPTPLSPIEIEVFRDLWDGKTIMEIAQERFVTPKTIETHRAQLYLKSGIKNRLSLLFRWGLEEEYLKP